MEFILCKHGPLGLDVQYVLEDIESEEEAIYKAHDAALQTKEGFLVALFTHDGYPIAGWEVHEKSKLQKKALDMLAESCGISKDSYDFIKKHAKQMQKAKDERINGNK